eukprot:CAMPEP_0201489648 /NCGR_PEP_ID=MMETSP0151_2-20130828/23145_1 /ASSEMBLY_ACC=CAM_ASM_000257 /TAXON_ID=200890 /ORGANISM="Paramoeba atlantica, Strain 621/1 / CCAP 1560/9" /LENGTH=336 /DNA_ID=CAMNT_0047875307 /DNA_START=523 /DNA_END=1530 /DNA_ORIENTATION=-
MQDEREAFYEAKNQIRGRVQQMVLLMEMIDRSDTPNRDHFREMFHNSYQLMRTIRPLFQDDGELMGGGSTLLPPLNKVLSNVMPPTRQLPPPSSFYPPMQLSPHRLQPPSPHRQPQATSPTPPEQNRAFSARQEQNRPFGGAESPVSPVGPQFSQVSVSLRVNSLDHVPKQTRTGTKLYRTTGSAPVMSNQRSQLVDHQSQDVQMTESPVSSPTKRVSQFFEQPISPPPQATQTLSPPQQPLSPQTFLHPAQYHAQQPASIPYSELAVSLPNENGYDRFTPMVSTLSASSPPDSTSPRPQRQVASPPQNSNSSPQSQYAPPLKRCYHCKTISTPEW